jgi:hypothetical protein
VEVAMHSQPRSFEHNLFTIVEADRQLGKKEVEEKRIHWPVKKERCR